MTFRNQFMKTFSISNIDTRVAKLGQPFYLSHEVCDGLMPKDEVEDLVQRYT